MARDVLIVGIVLLFGLPAGAVSKPGIHPALAAFIAGQYAEAESNLQKMLRQAETDRAQIYYLLGRINAWEGDVKAAFDWFETAVEADPANADYRYRLGMMYGAKAQGAIIFRKPGYARRARKAFENAVRLNPGHLAARTKLVEYHLYAPGILSGNTDKAREQADEIKSRNPTEGHLVWGLIHAREKAQDSVEIAYLAAVESASDDPRPVLWLASLYGRTERRLEAIQVLETYLQSFPDEGVVLRKLSALYRQEKAYEKASEAAQRSLKVAIDSLSTLKADSNASVQSFENALTIHSNRINALYEIGRFSATTGMNLDRGLESLNAFLSLVPERWRAHRARGYYRLGGIYVHLGDRDLARNAYRKVLHLNKKHKGAQKALKDLE